jgi:tetratricopeptide (TPR) repeat protein
MLPNSPLDSVYFITLPEGFELSKHAMHIDTSIPLPVQKKTSESSDSFNMQDLTQEQILAGILTVLAYDKQNEHLDYYRSILKEARPNIKVELSEAAVLKTKNEDYEMAEEIFSALQGFDPDDIAITLNTALFFDQRADSYRRMNLQDDADAYDDSAFAYYKIALAAEPPVPDAFFNAGFFYLKRHDFRNARDCFETYIALTCDIKDEDLGESGIYKKERAQEIINQIKYQNMDDANYKSAYDLISQGKDEEGIEKIREFLQRNPKVWNAWFMLGWGLRKLQRWEAASQAFVQAIDCGAEENADTHNELALCLIEMGQLKEAKESLINALSLEPENTKVISNLGFLALKQNNQSEAQKYFATVLELNPEDKIAKEELKKLEI